MKLRIFRRGLNGLGKQMLRADLLSTPTPIDSDLTFKDQGKLRLLFEI